MEARYPWSGFQPRELFSCRIQRLGPTIAYGATAYIEYWCSQEATALLERRGLKVDAASEHRLAVAVAAAVQRASLTLASLAAGRVETDQVRPTMFAHETARTSAGQPRKALKFSDLLDGWAAEKQPVAKTIYEWRRVTAKLVQFLGFDDPSRVTAEDLLRWKAEMITGELRPKTIRDAQLAPIRAIFRWAVDNRLLPNNPADRVTIDVRQKPGMSVRSFNDEEATLILKAALLCRCARQDRLFMAWEIHIGEAGEWQ